MKCICPRCRNKAAKGRRICHKHRMQQWRERHPIADAWNTHTSHAKARGIPVLWTREEFYTFCQNTGYHFLRKNGLTIERKDCLVGYSLNNCQTLSHIDNSVKGSWIDRWIKNKLRRKKVA